MTEEKKEGDQPSSPPTRIGSPDAKKKGVELDILAVEASLRRAVHYVRELLQQLQQKRGAMSAYIKEDLPFGLRAREEDLLAQIKSFIKKKS